MTVHGAVSSPSPACKGSSIGLTNAVLPGLQYLFASAPLALQGASEVFASTHSSALTPLTTMFLPARKAT